MNKKIYSFRNDLRTRLKNLQFKKAWQESEPEYFLARQLIKIRLEQGLSQRQLARNAKTTQAIISRLETMQANPPLALIKRLAQALNRRVAISLR